MYLDVCTVPSQRISESDERYRFTRGTASASLRSSIIACGCFSPPICVLEDEHYVPVTGFKRLQVLCDIASEVVVSVVRGADDPILLLALAANEIRTKREPTPFERSRAFHCAQGLGASRADIASRLAPALGLDPHEVVVRRHLMLLRVEESLAEWLERKGVSLKRALAFTRTRPEDARRLVDLITGLDPSARALEEWHRMLLDISKRDGTSLSAVLDGIGHQLPLETESNLSPADRANRLRESLWALRYPAWSTAQVEVEKILHKLCLPDGAEITWDRQFEKEGCSLILPIRILEQFRRDLVSLSDEHQLALFAELLDAL